MKKVLIATKNKGKMREFEKMFHPLGYLVTSLLDYPEVKDVDETGDTFQENARLKSETISQIFNTTTIADDSGLIVDALGGKPGVHSARYAGEQKNDQANVGKLLKDLKGIPDEQRTARFCTVLAVSVPGRPTQYFEGFCEGRISKERKGENGFGYDPIFYLPELKQTMAEIPSEIKNTISHRAEAMKKLKEAMSLGDLL